MKEQTKGAPPVEPVKVVPPASHKSGKLFGLLIAVVAIVAIGVVAYCLLLKEGESPTPVVPGVEDQQPPGDEKSEKIKAFESEDDFKEWMALADMYGEGYGYFGMTRTSAVEAMPMLEMGMDAAPTALGIGAATKAEPSRVSETNVQVSGIDEPDIVKTDGNEIYYSPERYYYWRDPMPLIEQMLDVKTDESTALMPPKPMQQGIRAIAAFPPADLAIDSSLEETGEMLLKDDILAVFTYESIKGMDVADPTSVSQSWELKYNDRHEYVTSRLYGDTIYLVTRANIRRGDPCPIVPLYTSEEKITIPCGRVYHPVAPVPSDVTYSVVAIDMATGDVKQSMSFVGSWQSSAIYMSAEHLYATYTYSGDVVDFMFGFFDENSDLMPEIYRSRISNLGSYDISLQAKIMELQVIMEEWMNSLGNDEYLRIENELENRMDDYYRRHMRELQSTGIVKISIDDLSVVANGTVPGHLLNQFSLDEYEGHLRAATTVGGRGGLGWQFGFSTQDSENDVYVLDGDLKEVGSVTGLGEDERIYSARFIQDKGYIVTFRETDPFYVLDLSNPSAPEMKGELKIPGYSSYLHPITKNDILGIGKEDGQVKLSLFDVSDPTNPTEKSKYTLDEYWSDVLNTHHAFLLDADHEIFFMPGGRGGYIFSYEDGDLSLTKAVSEVRAKRALYINDYLYIVGDDKIVVLNESDWERVNELDLR